MSTWSDSKAVMDYQNFLQSGKQEPEMKPDMASVIITDPSSSSSSEMAEALTVLGMGDDLVIEPNQDLPTSMDGESEYPIYISLPPTKLKGMRK